MLGTVPVDQWQSYLRYSSAVTFAVPAGLIGKADLPPGCGLIVRGPEGWRTLKAFKPFLEGGFIDNEVGDGHLFTAFFRDECEMRWTGEPRPNDLADWPPKRYPADADDLKYKETDGTFYTVRTPLAICTNLYGDLRRDARLLLPPTPATPRTALPAAPGTAPPLAVNWTFRVSAAGERAVLPAAVLQQSEAAWGAAARSAAPTPAVAAPDPSARRPAFTLPGPTLRRERAAGPVPAARGLAVVP